VSRFRRDLEELRRLNLNRLHFGIRSLGLLALDLSSGREVFAVTGESCPVQPAEVALGGASIPGLFPWVRCEHPGGVFRLVDGGLSHSLPVERALTPPFSGGKIVAVDLQVLRGFRERHPDRWLRLEREHPGRIVRLVPKVDGAGTVFFNFRKARDLVRWGEEAVLERCEALC
jgi:predicted acylesterase/phospholipase RssA